MASYRGHLAFSSALGAAYSSGAVFYWDLDWGPAFLAAGLTALGGMAPDLDSDSGVPVRELFGLVSAFAPFLLLHRFVALGFTREQTLALMGGTYLIMRYGCSKVFKHFTVHRGMFHSIPALLISGLLVFLAYHNPSLSMRLFLAGGMMLGFLSHLVLDELCSVDISGVSIKLNQFAGSALKFFGPSFPANLVAYLLLAGLIYLATIDLGLVDKKQGSLQYRALMTWIQVTRRPG